MPATLPLYPLELLFVARKCPRAGIEVPEVIVKRVVTVPELFEPLIFHPPTSNAESLLL